MKRSALCFVLLILSVPAVRAQAPEIKFVADTLVVEADGTFEADPDLATLTFDISSQGKELKPSYDRASQSIQKIVALAGKNGLKADDVSSGVLTVSPTYDRKSRAKWFSVRGQVVLKVRDFANLGAIMEGTVDDDITDFRSLTYSLADEESAKERAVAIAMRRAIDRASAALGQKNQKVGALRFGSIDVKQAVGVVRLESYASSSTEISGGAFGIRKMASPSVPPPPLPPPNKITVSARVQCAFQIQ